MAASDPKPKKSAAKKRAKVVQSTPAQTLSVREFRANLASAFETAAQGGTVHIAYAKRGDGRIFTLREAPAPPQTVVGCMAYKTEQLVPDEELFSAEDWDTPSLPDE